MPQFSANLSILWTELDVYDRFEAAAHAGFQLVEIGVIEDLDHQRLRRSILESGQTLVLFNPGTGDAARGELGLVAVPGRDQDFAQAINRALDQASLLGTKKLNALLGVVPEADRGVAQSTAIRNLSAAARLSEQNEVTLLVESVNSVDVPGYFAPTTRDAAELVEAVGHPSVRMLFDVYHSAQMGENPLESLRTYIGLIAHIHIADFPGRNEPGTGRQNIVQFISECERLGYQGFIGLEYKPSRDTDSSLGWLKSFAD